MAFYFVSTFAIAQTPTKQPALRLSRTKNLHFAKAPFPGFSAGAEKLSVIDYLAFYMESEREGGYSSTSKLPVRQ